MGLPVAGLQIDSAWEDPPASFARADVLAAGAVAGGARLVVLPEMFATGYSMAADAIAAHGDAVRRYLAALAARHGVWVAGGLVEPGAPRPFNACAVFDPHGAEAGCYRKIHPFSLAGEDRHYAAGTALVTVAVDGLRVTPLICYDLRFPEPFRAAADRTDLFVVIASWPEARRQHWSALLRARAIENQAFVLGVNRVGAGGGLAYVGDSALVDPLGEVIATACGQPAVVAGAVDGAAVAEARARFSFLADRRPDVYAGW